MPAAPAPQQAIRAELAYYPSAAPLRARILAQEPETAAPYPGAAAAAGVHRQIAQRLAQNPWIDRHPVSVTGVPVRHKGRWLLADEALDTVRLKGGHNSLFDLAAFAGGRPVSVFGEWMHDRLTPLSAWRDDEEAIAL